MPEVSPSAWLEYGGLGLAGLTMLLSMSLTFWTTKKSFSILEKTNRTFGKLLAALEDYGVEEPDEYKT